MEEFIYCLVKYIFIIILCSMQNVLEEFRSRGVLRTLHSTKNQSFSLKISSVNVAKTAVSCGFGHINWRNSWKTSFFVQCYQIFMMRLFYRVLWQMFDRNLTLSCRRSLSYRNQSIDLLCIISLISENERNFQDTKASLSLLRMILLPEILDFF